MRDPAQRVLPAPCTASRFEGQSITLGDGLDGYNACVLASCADGSAVSGYAKGGMACCVDEGIVTGTTGGEIQPATKITRDLRGCPGLR